MNTTAFDFDAVPDRSASSSLKWDRYQGRDVVPLWVADMDFRSPPAVLAALHGRIDHGVFGYTLAPDSLVAATIDHLRRRYGWAIEPEWLIWLPGLVCGLNVVCRATGDVGDEVVVCSPIYPPFMSAPTLMGRTAVTVPLRQSGSRWEMDIEAMERAITPKTRLLLLCNPHNPVGRVWTEPELRAVAELAVRRDLIVCSDEVHADLILDADKQHLPLAMLGPEIARRTVTLHAPSKTYNIPGLGCSFAVVADPGLRQSLRRAMDGIVPHVNLLGYAAAEAAFRFGEPWRLALLDYLRGNRDAVMAAAADMDGVTVSPVEAMYLAWLDVRQTGISRPGRFFEQAGVGLADGAEFGLPGFVRLNFGCARSLLSKGLERMRRALA